MVMPRDGCTSPGRLYDETTMSRSSATQDLRKAQILGRLLTAWEKKPLMKLSSLLTQATRGRTLGLTGTEDTELCEAVERFVLLSPEGD